MNNLRYFLFIVLVTGLSLTRPSSLRAADSSATGQQQIELSDPRDYSVKRFNEVVSKVVENTPDSTQEKLISERARLAIAERQLQELITRQSNAQSTEEKKDSPKPQHIRAAEAKIDHYQKLVQQLEDQVLREKRKERSAATTPKTRKR